MVIVDFRTESRFPVNRDRIRKTIEEVISRHGLKAKVEIGLSIVGDRKMSELNGKYLKHEGTTDVLSFPLESGGVISKRGTPDAPSGFVAPPDGVLHLGDVVISYPQAVKQAAEKNELVDEEISILVEHGVLHLLGIHHEE